MPFFTKKPVTIEAIQWTGDNFDEISNFIGEHHGHKKAHEDAEERTIRTGEYYIRTLEDVMTASKGDWIIKGVKGEFYPCKPDIFEITYSPTNHQNSSSGVESAGVWVKASERLPEIGRRVICKWSKYEPWDRIEITDAHQLKHWIENDGTDQGYEWLDESAAAPSLKSYQPCIVMPGISSDPNFGELPGAKITIPISSLKEIAMGFHEWIEFNGYEKNQRTGRYYGYGGKYAENLAVLYDLYIESLNKKP